jgi:integrase
MQRGVIVKHRRSWTLLYYDVQFRDGKRQRVRVSKKLALVSKEYPTDTSVRTLADKILAPINGKELQPESSLKVTEFIEDHYFPAMEGHLRPSTFLNYKKSIYEPHLKKRLGKIRLRDFRTVHGQRILREIPKVGHSTLMHIKNFLSGVFKFAKQSGVLDGLNPMVDVSAPGKPTKFKGAAYSIQDVERMIEDIENEAEKVSVKKKPGQQKLKVYQTATDVIALLSLTGLRQSECRGLRWSDWNEANETLMVSRAVWTNIIGPTKNPSSESTIPVLPLLRDLLIKRRERIQPRPGDYIFAGTAKGRPLDFHNLANRILKRALRKPKLNNEPGVEWFGYHGFRRGLASNLFALGVNPKIVGAILRHSGIAMALQFYIKTPDSESREAMHKLEDKIRNMPSGVLVNGRQV